MFARNVQRTFWECAENVSFQLVMSFFQKANYYGSLLESSTVCLGSGPDGEVHVPFRDLLPMVHPNDVVFDGWDISSLDLGRAMERAQVLDWSLQEKLRPHMNQLKPRPSVYIPGFIAANQEHRADNLIRGTKAEQVRHCSQLHCLWNISATLYKVSHWLTKLLKCSN